jgi:multidrug efflux system outer membrane protein
MTNFIMSKCRLSILVTALALSGCTMIPEYERPAAAVDSHYPGTSETQAAQAAADIAWRDVFSDERLKKLVELALVNNLDLRVAVLNVEESRAQYRITRSTSFPGVNAGGGYTRSHAGDLTSDQWSANLGATAYELDFFGRVRSLNKQALEKYLATAEAQRSAQISLVAEVASQYFTLRQAEAQLDLARETLATVQESYGLNKASFDAGEGTELNLRTAEGQVQSAQISILTYERLIAQSQNALVLLIGESLPVDLPPPRPFSDANLVAGVPAGLPSELVQRRPDILEAEHTLKAANANIGAARAAFFPTIALTGSIGTTSSEFKRLFDSGTGVWSFSPQVTLPIFTGGQNLASLDSAKVGARIEVANYQKAVQTAFREVADALVAASSYSREIEAQSGLISTRQIRFNLANVRYRQGEDSYLNVLSAQQDLYAAQQSLLQAKLNKLASQISLYKALGGGWK